MTDIPVWLEIDDVMALLPSDWTPRAARDALERAGVLRRISRKRRVIVTDRLRESMPELYRALLRQRLTIGGTHSLED